MHVKNLVFKTIFITFGIVLILAVAIFGIVSLAAPVAMMRFTRSLGLIEVSGDYAFQEYERSGSISYLADSFIIAAEHKNDAAAEERFELLYNYDQNGTTFAAFCEEQNEKVVFEKENGEEEEYPAGTYRAYLCGLAACVKYRLAEEDAAVIGFALGETEKTFPAGNPAIALAVETVKAKDEGFCADLLAAIEAEGYEKSEDLAAICELLRAVQAN